MSSFVGVSVSVPFLLPVDDFGVCAWSFSLRVSCVVFLISFLFRVCILVGCLWISFLLFVSRCVFSVMRELRPPYADSFDVCAPSAPVGGCRDGSTFSAS